MPHFGLMDEGSMEPAEAALLRARLHLRSGRRRLRQGKLAAGLSTVYDALLSGLRFFVLSHPHLFSEPLDMENDLALFEAVRRAGAAAADLDFSRLENLVEKAAAQQPLELDWRQELTVIEEQLGRVGVLPFEESSLPAENPDSF